MKILPFLLFSVTLVHFSYAQNSPVIIELFTSQGCSSCPAADKNLSEILERSHKEGTQVYGLSFHVDYWNYIGWKDPYSSKAFTERQRNYGEQMNLRSIYTPQMIVNGKDEFVGSNKSELEISILAATKHKPAYQIYITDFQLTASGLSFRYSIDKAPTLEVMNIAIVEKNVQNYVPRGENGGRKLHHDNVVRFFVSRPLKQDESIQIPAADINYSSSSLILYVQDEDWHIIGATTKLLN